MRPYEGFWTGRTVTSASTVKVKARPLTGRAVLAALLGFFGVVIGVNGVMIALAIGTMPGLENEKPYQAGIAYNAEIEAARAQAGRRWTVMSHVTRDALGRATIAVNAHDASFVADWMGRERGHDHVLRICLCTDARLVFWTQGRRTLLLLAFVNAIFSNGQYT